VGSLRHAQRTRGRAGRHDLRPRRGARRAALDALGAARPSHNNRSPTPQGCARPLGLRRTFGPGCSATRSATRSPMRPTAPAGRARRAHSLAGARPVQPQPSLQGRRPGARPVRRHRPHPRRASPAAAAPPSSGAPAATGQPPTPDQPCEQLVLPRSTSQTPPGDTSRDMSGHTVRRTTATAEPHGRHDHDLCHRGGRIGVVSLSRMALQRRRHVFNV
jgi:hypothetical protein